MSLNKVESGDAVLYVGDPRLGVSQVDEWLTQCLEGNTWRPLSRPYLYGSDAGFCARRNVLLEKNEWIDGNLNAAGMGYMVIGNAFEDLLANSLKQRNRLISQNLYLIEMPELKVRGKIDLVVFDHEDELALIEVKTCGELPLEPKPTHLAQIQTYAAISGVRRCWLTYMSRKLHPKQPIPLRSFLVDTSAGALEDKLRIAFLSRLAFDKGSLPPVPGHFRKHTECHYCEFRDHFCYGGRRGHPFEASPPLPELSPVQVIELDALAVARAKDLMLSIEDRRIESIKSFLNVSPLSLDLVDRLNSLLVRVLK